MTNLQRAAGTPPALKKIETPPALKKIGTPSTPRKMEMPPALVKMEPGEDGREIFQMTNKII